MPIKHLDSRRVCNVPLKESALEGAEGEALPESDHYQVNVAGEKKMKDNVVLTLFLTKLFLGDNQPQVSLLFHLVHGG